MPKPSSDLAHSFMISRSESEPITMETSGLLKLSLLFFYQRTGADIFAVIHSFEADLSGRFISAIERYPEITRASGDSEYPSAGSDEIISAFAGARVEHLHSFDLRSFFQSGDDFAGLKDVGISAGGDNHTSGRVG